MARHGTTRTRTSRWLRCAAQAALGVALIAPACSNDPEQEDLGEGEPAASTTGGLDAALGGADAAFEDASSDAGDGAAGDAPATTGGDRGCYECLGSYESPCPGFACAQAQPCETFVRYDDDGSSGGTGVSNPPVYEHTNDGGECILQALQAGSQGKYTIRHNPGGQYSDTTVLHVLAERRAVLLEEHFMDLGYSSRESARMLRDASAYDSCFADADAMWQCLLEPLDESACYAESLRTCP